MLQQIYVCRNRRMKTIMQLPRRYPAYINAFNPPIYDHLRSLLASLAFFVRTDSRVFWYCAAHHMHGSAHVSMHHNIPTWTTTGVRIVRTIMTIMIKIIMMIIDVSYYLTSPLLSRAACSSTSYAASRSFFSASRCSVRRISNSIAWADVETLQNASELCIYTFVLTCEANMMWKLLRTHEYAYFSCFTFIVSSPTR